MLQWHMDRCDKDTQKGSATSRNSAAPVCASGCVDPCCCTAVATDHIPHAAWALNARHTCVLHTCVMLTTDCERHICRSHNYDCHTLVCHTCVRSVRMSLCRASV
jgi:hypothetical protein